MAAQHTQEELRGWVGTIGFHLLLALLLFLWERQPPDLPPEFVEVSWGSTVVLPTSMPSAAAQPGGEGATRTSAAQVNSPVDLPEQTFKGAGEALPPPDAKKLNVEERPAATLPPAAASGTGRKEQGLGQGTGSRLDRGRGAGEVAGDLERPSPVETAGDGTGSGVSMSMQWSDGGTRKKISGELPEYPEGTNVQAQIKIEAMVTPDGGIKNLKPAQKGNTRLEEAAMKAVRLWRFEPLRRSLPQRDQICVITFNFRLQ